MLHKRAYSVIVLLLVFALVISACSPRDPVAVEPDVEFLLELPRIHIVYGEDGRAQSLAGLDANVFAQLGIALPDLGAWVGTMQAANIQHLELAHNGRGIFVFVNGEPIPGIGWDAASLRTTQDLLRVFEPQIPFCGLVISLVPLIQRLGIGFVAIFPPAAGEAEIPIREPGTRLDFAAEAAETVAADPGAGARVRLHLSYDDRGEPSVLGISAADLEQLTGASLQPARIDAGTLGFFQAANIQHIALTHRPGGIWLYLNNRPLPNIAWSAETLNNVADVYEALYGTDAVVALIREVLPVVDLADIDIVIRLPAAEGVTAIPVLPPEER